jgi:hypothetical protein
MDAKLNESKTKFTEIPDGWQDAGYGSMIKKNTEWKLKLGGRQSKRLEFVLVPTSDGFMVNIVGYTGRPLSKNKVSTIEEADDLMSKMNSSIAEFLPANAKVEKIS